MIESDSIFATFYPWDHALFSSPEDSDENPFFKTRFSKHLQWPPNAFAPNEKGAWDLMLLP
jgi:hypothetical protein